MGTMTSQVNEFTNLFSSNNLDSSVHVDISQANLCRVMSECICSDWNGGDSGSDGGLSGESFKFDLSRARDGVTICVWSTDGVVLRQFVEVLIVQCSDLKSRFTSPDGPTNWVAKCYLSGRSGVGNGKTLWSSIRVDWWGLVHSFEWPVSNLCSIGTCAVTVVVGKTAKRSKDEAT
eukprot:c10130_g1_i5.p1 GENE.c10130_g1_i5~~c10130_g1_i5.p1  ORF type:complete len:176 (+),score=37.57 c10130_g1_i5:634-1161(+)